jgi:hypothetical protein
MSWINGGVIPPEVMERDIACAKKKDLNGGFLQ